MTIESVDEARAALKLFFEAERELTASLIARAITRTTYFIALQGLRDSLCAKSYLSIFVLRNAEDLLESPAIYLGVEHRERADQLRKHLAQAYDAWLEDFRRVNAERTALAVLDMIAGLTVPPLPT